MQLATLPPLPTAATLLARSASLSRDLAERTCLREGDSGESCAWFHGLWPDLRLLGLVDSPADHADFFESTMRPLLDTHRRILIGGAADNAMLAEILSIYGDHAEVTVIDRCPTPLAVNHWLAEQHGTAIASIAHDILALDSELMAPFDLICAHGTLEHFEPDVARPRLVSQWRRMLRPGGKVVLIESMRAPGASLGRRYSPAEAAALRDEAVARYARCRPLAGLDPARLARRIDRFAQRAVAWSLGSTEELVGLVAHAGLVIESMSPHGKDTLRVVLTRR